jgi:hypothetical protein
MPKKTIYLANTAGQNPYAFNMGSRLLFLKIALFKINQLGKRIISFYVEGFRRMKLGRTLWAIIVIKLLIMFGVLKIFFFPNYLHEHFTTDMERADHVSSSLTQIPTVK